MLWDEDAILEAKRWVSDSASIPCSFTDNVNNFSTPFCTVRINRFCIQYSQKHGWRAGCKRRDLDVNFDDLNVVPHLLTMCTDLAGHLSVYHCQILPERIHSCSWEASKPRMAWRIYAIWRSKRGQAACKYSLSMLTSYPHLLPVAFHFHSGSKRILMKVRSLGGDFRLCTPPINCDRLSCCITFASMCYDRSWI